MRITLNGLALLRPGRGGYAPAAAITPSSCPGRTTIGINHDPLADALIARALDAANCRRLTPAAIATPR